MKFNFIVCEDQKIIRAELIKVIKKVAKKIKIEFTLYEFNHYNAELEAVINEDIENKIYILDIVMPNKKGTEIASQIRKNDLDSLIIFVTAEFDDYEDDILNGEYMILKYINKFDDYKEILYQTLYNNINKKFDTLIVINSKDVFYKLNSKYITQIYFKKRKTVIQYNSHHKVELNLSLAEVKQSLNNNFVYSKRNCIVNLEQIKNIDKVNKIITFKNDEQTDKLSKKNMKDILKLLK